MASKSTDSEHHNQMALSFIIYDLRILFLYYEEIIIICSDIDYLYIMYDNSTYIFLPIPHIQDCCY